jgi:glucan phosphoethanolaminetransferase (alkaline phosphatase superfamily)
MENKFKYSIGLYLIFSHLVIIVSIIALRILGGFDKNEFTTIVGIVTPMFTGFTTSIIMFIIANRYNTQSSPDIALSSAFKLLSYLFPTLFSFSVLLAIWLQGYHLAFSNFEDFKSFILAMESLFAAYSGYFVYTLFEKKKTGADQPRDRRNARRTD